MQSPDLTADEKARLACLESRLGRVYIRQRLGLEHDFETQVFRRGTHFFHLENWYSIHGLIRGTLRLLGLHDRGRRNAQRITVRRHEIALPNLPQAFDGCTLLHLSDLHLDINDTFVDTLLEAIAPLRYDICVLTGDYRARTFGRFDRVLAGLVRLRAQIRGPAFAILGNHDTLRLVPAMEAMGYRLLVNEFTCIARGDDRLYLAGVDDAHFYRLDNFHRAADEIPADAASVLLCHTPEAYRHAAHAGFDLMLCGHTHGGQICLPGGMPVLTDADSPRRFARGFWRHHDMIGYTSVGAGTSIIDVRLNCPPEVALHCLRSPATRPA